MEKELLEKMVVAMCVADAGSLPKYWKSWKDYDPIGWMEKMFMARAALKVIQENNG